jgi:hypothetical protein
VERSDRIDQPTTARVHASTVAARYRNPSHVATYLMSETHRASGPGAAKLRSTRSGAGAASGSRRVVRTFRLRWMLRTPAAHISLATRLRPTRIPWPRWSSAWMRGDP